MHLQTLHKYGIGMFLFFLFAAEIPKLFYCNEKKYPLYFSSCFYHMVLEPKTHVKGRFSNFIYIFLWHESEDINKKKGLFQLIPILSFKVMHDYVCFIAPIDYCVE